MIWFVVGALTHTFLLSVLSTSELKRISVGVNANEVDGLANACVLVFDAFISCIRCVPGVCL